MAKTEKRNLKQIGKKWCPQYMPGSKTFPAWEIPAQIPQH